MLRNATAAAFITVVLSGCALYNDVSVMPLQLKPTEIDRGSDVQTMVRKADFLRAMSTAAAIDAKAKPGAAEMAALGRACLFSGRFAEARSRLRASLDLHPTRQAYAETAWDLSQVEFLENNLELSLDWAGIAMEHGLQIKRWHLDYLEALKGVSLYTFRGDGSVRVPFQFGRPSVPRVKARINGTVDAEGIIDSGAVLSIVSERLAKQIPLRSLGNFEGTFYGLLGEPITVRFGILESLTIGNMVVENVPVAVMPDEKMRFLINRETREEYHMNFLLGSNLLKEFRLDLNFDRHDVTFTRLTERDRRPDPDQNLFFNGFRPHVRGAVNRQGWFLFILDTGSEITFLNQSRLGSLPISFLDSGGHTATLQGLGGSMKRGAKLENVEVGFDRWSGVFKTIPMYSSDDNVYAVGIVGQNFLEKFNVVIDFGRMRVDLERR